MRDLDLRSGRRVLLALMTVDCALLVVHAVQRIVSERDERALLAGTRLSLSTEHGVGEVFGYAKTALVVTLLLLAWRRSGRQGSVFAGWAVMFATILLDDSAQVHELSGRFLVRHSDGEVLGLDSQQLGELVAWGLLSVLPLLLITMLHRASLTLARQRSWVLAALVGTLIFFGAGLDTIHELLDDGSTRAWVIGSVEDGGELLVMSVIAAYVVAFGGAGGSSAPGAPVGGRRPTDGERVIEEGAPAPTAAR